MCNTIGIVTEMSRQRPFILNIINIIIAMHLLEIEFYSLISRLCLSHFSCSSLLIVYEGYEEMKENASPTAATSIDMDDNAMGGGEQLKPMEDDSHSGNCSYDADASNDSIELNLSLDEHEHQQYYYQV